MDLERIIRPNKVALLDINGQRLSLSENRCDREYRCLWHGGLLRPFRETIQPKLAIFAMEFDSETRKGGGVECFSINVADSPLLRVDDIFMVDVMGKARTRFRVCRDEVTKNVDFSPSGWSFCNIHEDGGLVSKIYNNPLFRKYFSGALSIKFITSDGYSVIVPSIELFNTTYGGSSYVRRQLLSHDFETVKEKLFADRELTKSPEGRWLVKTTKRCLKQDLPFLASLYYDNYARQVIKRLIAERMINLNRDIYFPVFKPWFQHRGELTFVGSYIESQKTYLATQIRGFSLPDMPIIDDLRKVIDKLPEEEGVKEVGPYVYQVEDPDLDINSDQRPDNIAGVATITSDPIAVENKPIITRAGEREEQKKKEHDDVIGEEVEEVSSDEGEGVGKEVGATTIRHAEGSSFTNSLLLLWRSLFWYQNEFPQKLEGVSYYTLLNGRRRDHNLKMQALWNHDGEPESKWLHLAEKGRSRGMLVAEMELQDSIRVLVFSIERHVKIKDEKLVETDSYRGLMCTLQTDKTLAELVCAIVESFEAGATHFDPLGYDGFTDKVELFRHYPCRFIDSKTERPIRYKTLVEHFVRFGLQKKEGEK